MANLSQQKRERMLAFLNKVKEEHKDDDETLVALDEIENELNSKKYGLVWEKHEEQVDVMMQDNIPVFSEVKEREIKATDKNAYNFLLEGDNLHSLKLLEKTHAGKIDVIYIDPPYNTKSKEFIYDDYKIGEDDTYRHSKWLSFMNERLQLAKLLLSDEGVIFMSIDEHEFAQLKLLSDNIFGVQNFIENFIWVKNSTKNTSKTTSTNHEYVLCFAKNIDVLSSKEKFRKHKEGYEAVLNIVDSAKLGGKTPAEAQKLLREFYKKHNELKGISLYNFVDENWNIYQSDNSSAPKSTGVSQTYDVIHPITGKACKVPSRGWAYCQETMQQHIANNRILFGKDETTVPRFKRFLKDVKTEVRKSVISDYSDGKKELQKIFGQANFNNAKPTTLIADLLGTFGKHVTILDFFAGSGTTAQAVLELNKEDGGNRKFILCTNNENHICEEVTYERIKRVINGYADVEGIPANLKYFKTDFIPKDADDVSEELLSHIKEMVELENGITLDNQHYLIVLTDEQADALAKNWSSYGDVRAIYVSRDVLLTTEQQACFAGTEIHVIPDYYFEYELKEAGEAW